MESEQERGKQQDTNRQRLEQPALETEQAQEVEEQQEHLRQQQNRERTHLEHQQRQQQQGHLRQQQNRERAHLEHQQRQQQQVATWMDTDTTNSVLCGYTQGGQMGGRYRIRYKIWAIGGTALRYERYGSINCCCSALYDHLNGYGYG